MKRLWLVRLGKNAEFESDALDKSLLSIGFNVTADLSGAKDRDAVLDRLRGAASRRIEACSCCRHGREGPRLRGFPDLPSKSQVNRVLWCRSSQVTSTLMIPRFRG